MMNLPIDSPEPEVPEPEKPSAPTPGPPETPGKPSPSERPRIEPPSPPESEPPSPAPRPGRTTGPARADPVDPGAEHRPGSRARGDAQAVVGVGRVRAGRSPTAKSWTSSSRLVAPRNVFQRGL